MPAVLEANHVTIAYEKRAERSRLLALQDLTLSVTAGEFLALVGPSGCGKTTFLNAIAGLVQPTAGTLTMDGRPIVGPGPDRAMVFQEYALMPWLATWDNVAFGLELRGQLRGEDGRRRVAQFIELVGLRGFERSFPHELSGGMRQRVGLARALVMDPRILLMDEPFASLDAQTRSFMQLELLKIWQRAKKTVIFVTHMISEAILLSDRVLVLSRRPGRIRSEFEVDIDRPRNIESKANLRFIELENLIWHQIEEEVRSLGEFPATEEIPSEAERSSGASGTL